MELFFDVVRSNRRYSERTYGRLNPFRGQYRCLFALEEVGTISQKDLSALLAVRPASVSELLLKLEQKQLVKRVTDREDNRVSRVSLTELGKNEVKNIQKKRAQTHSEMLSGLTPGEKEGLYTALQKMKAFYTAKETEKIHE